MDHDKQPLAKKAAEIVKCHINQSKTRSDQQPNLVSISGGKWTLSSGDWQEFWKYYIAAIDAGAKLDYCEVPSDVTALRLDVDIQKIVDELESDGDKELLTVGSEIVYTPEEELKLVTVCNAILAAHLHQVDSSLINCIVLTKPARSQFVDIDVDGEKKRSRRIVRGIHLMWPLICLAQDDQREFANQVAKESKNQGLFSWCTKSPIDMMSSAVPWLLYGGCKPNLQNGDETIIFEPYVISCAHDVAGNLIDIDQLLSRVVLINEITEEAYSNISNFQKLTIRSCGRQQQRLLIEREQVVARVKMNTIKSDVPISTLQGLVNLLSPQRAVDYSSWIDVGRCLASITDQSDQGLELFDEFSQHCAHKYATIVCSAKWDTFRKRDKGLGLLISWAKNDNPELYQQWHDKESHKRFANMKRNTSGELATIASRFFESQYAYSNNNWYIFRSPCWEDLQKKKEDTIPIRRELNGPFKAKLESFLKELRKETGTENAQKFVDAAICKLDEPGGLTSVIEMLKLHMHDRDFADSLDKNNFLVGVKNGVVDLKTGEFRIGRPEDKISMTFNCNYVQYDNDGPEMTEMRLLWRKMFTDDDLRQYMLNIMCQVFVGSMFLKNLFFWIGNGDNGKTVFGRLFQEMLGPNFFQTLSTSVLTGNKQEAGRAAPELLSINGKKMVIFGEPEKNETLSNGIIKSLTGKDPQFARELFQKGGDVVAFIVMAIFVFITNDAPEVKNNSDQALWARVVVCPFTSNYVDAHLVPATEEEQFAKAIFLKDPDFLSDLPRLAPILFWYLLQHWCKIKSDLKTIQVPDCVLKASQNYKERNDQVRLFLDDYCQEDEMCTLSIADFKAKFDSLSKKPLTGHRLVESLKKLGVDLKDGSLMQWRWKCEIE